MPRHESASDPVSASWWNGQKLIPLRSFQSHLFPLKSDPEWLTDIRPTARLHLLDSADFDLNINLALSDGETQLSPPLLLEGADCKHDGEINSDYQVSGPLGSRSSCFLCVWGLIRKANRDISAALLLMRRRDKEQRKWAWRRGGSLSGLAGGRITNELFWGFG